PHLGPTRVSPNRFPSWDPRASRQTDFLLRPAALSPAPEPGPRSVRIPLAHPFSEAPTGRNTIAQGNALDLSSQQYQPCKGDICLWPKLTNCYSALSGLMCVSNVNPGR